MVVFHWFSMYIIWPHKFNILHQFGPMEQSITVQWSQSRHSDALSSIFLPVHSVRGPFFCETVEHLTRGFPPILDSKDSKYCILVNYSNYYNLYFLNKHLLTNLHSLERQSQLYRYSRASAVEHSLGYWTLGNNQNCLANLLQHGVNRSRFEPVTISTQSSSSASNSFAVTAKEMNYYQ